MKVHLTAVIMTAIAPVIAAMALIVSGAQIPPPLSPPHFRVDYVIPAAAQPQERDANTIFYDDFDKPTSPDSRYLEYNRQGGSFARSEGDGYGGRGAAMKCTFDRGQVEAGSLKVLFGKNPLGRGVLPDRTFHEIYWRVYVRHEPGWEGNPAKLGRATCLATPDWGQGFIAHVWGGKGDSLCIDPATGIVDNKRVTTHYNDFDHLHWLGSRIAPTPIFSTAESGRWVCVESHIGLNTPGKNDGVFELSIDGKLEASRNDLDWQGTWNDYAINAVFLENYWNSGSVKRQSRCFDDFVISARPIGPIVAADPPTMARTAGAARQWEAAVAADSNGNDAVWESAPIDGAATTLAATGQHGHFSGTLAGKNSFTPGKTYWIRLRERDTTGAWSSWTAWHSPFTAASAAETR